MSVLLNQPPHKEGMVHSLAVQDHIDLLRMMGMPVRAVPLTRADEAIKATRVHVTDLLRGVHHMPLPERHFKRRLLAGMEADLAVGTSHQRRLC